MPNVASSPAATLASGNGRHTRSSGSPKPTCRPARAWTIGSQPAASRSGPVLPKPVMEQVTSRGLSARRSARSTPSRESTPGRKFSTTTSAERASARARRRSSGTRRSRTTERLPRFHATNRPGSRRYGSPRGRFDLEDVGALVGEQLPDERCGDVMAEFQDPQPREQAAGLRHRPTRSGLPDLDLPACAFPLKTTMTRRSPRPTSRLRARPRIRPAETGESGRSFPGTHRRGRLGAARNSAGATR